MIQTEDIRQWYDEDTLRLMADAFKIIHDMGVFARQAEANSSRLTHGFQERNPKELAKEIMQVQQTNRNLLALHEWAGNLKKELDK